jgi:hypothetical protein
LERSREICSRIEGVPNLIRKFEEAAYDELVAVIASYYEVSDELGDRFVARFEQTLHHIAEFPSSVPLADGRRRFRVPGFPYGIFMDANSQVILGVRHDARNPEDHPRLN